MSGSRWITKAMIVLVPGFVLIQVLPYGRDHAAPPDGQRAAFDSPRTEELARRACFDCHSNRTEWPWYSSVAPVSWRVQAHVLQGRAKLNFDALDTSTEEGAEAAGKAGEEAREGKMPLRDYMLMHGHARLTAAEREELARGLDRTFAAFVEREGKEHAEHTERAGSP